VKNKKIDRPTPIAFGADGHDVFINVFEFDGVETLEDAIGKLRGARFFIGIVLTGAERQRLRPYMNSAGREAAAFIAGKRRWK
jgi:hypothetical protein